MYMYVAQHSTVVVLGGLLHPLLAGLCSTATPSSTSSASTTYVRMLRDHTMEVCMYVYVNIGKTSNLLHRNWHKKQAHDLEGQWGRWKIAKPLPYMIRVGAIPLNKKKVLGMVQTMENLT